MRSCTLCKVIVCAAVAAASGAQPKTPEKAYAPMGVLDFIIDGPTLYKHGARVEVNGVYIREGAADVMYADRTALVRAHSMPNPQPHIAVIVENAARALRAKLVACQSDPMSMQLGCLVAIRGRVALCEVTSAMGVARQEPCLEAESEAPLSAQSPDLN